MSNSKLINVSPKSYIYEIAEREAKEKANIATEIYIAEQFTKVHYADLMSDIPEGCATKQRFTSWLNDNSRGKTVRPGIISLYKHSVKDDFVDGIWQANSFGSFIEFMKNTLCDKTFNGKKIADEFSQSFKSETWYFEAVAVAGLKLLEDLYEHSALRTNIAKAYIKHVIDSRNLLNKAGAIIGRVSKYHDISDMENELRTLFEVSFKTQLKASFEIFKNQEEYQIYLKYKPEILNSIRQIYLLNDPKLLAEEIACAN